MIAFQRQLNLRNIDVIISEPQKKVNQEKSSTSVQNKEADIIPVVPRSGKGKEVFITEPMANKDIIITKTIDKKDQSKQKIPPQELPEKSMDKKGEVTVVEPPVRPFNFESEIAKIKLSLPFNELCRNPEYKNQLLKMLKSGDKSGFSDTISLQDDSPTILFGPRMEPNDEDEVPPFYVTLKIHEHNLHNSMIDSGASHNLMPKEIMDALGLDITKQNKDLYSFDSRKVKCIGLIKDLVISLHQIPEKSIVIDIVVADVPPKFGMLLSRSWSAKLKGSMQMDFSYATIPVFNTQRRLWRKSRLKYMISSKECPENHPIYVVDTEMGSTIFLNSTSYDKSESPFVMMKNKGDNKEISEEPDISLEHKEQWFTIHFDGACSKEGSGVGIRVLAPFDVPKTSFSYKFYFNCTNNIAEYEALILGIKVLKDLKAKRVNIYGDSELVLRQVIGTYQAKHPRMREYKNLVLDMLEDFEEYNFFIIPRS